MSYLFPQGDAAGLGVLQVGPNINVDADSIISLPQSVDPTANVEFAKITSTGDVFGLKLFDNSKRVVTEVTPTSGAGISITALTSIGPSTSFAVNNTGVLSLVAGTGMVVSAATGIITISATGTDIIKTIGVTTNYTITNDDEYIGVDSTSLVTLTLPIGVTGRVYTIKEEHGNGTGKVNVQGNGSEKIDGSSFKQLAANASLTVVFHAGQWRII